MILKLGKRFLCFFDMSLQKTLKVTFFGFEKKNEKNVFSNYGIGCYVIARSRASSRIFSWKQTGILRRLHMCGESLIKKTRDVSLSYSSYHVVQSRTKALRTVLTLSLIHI